jgi:hypothetical protein
MPIISSSLSALLAIAAESPASFLTLTASPVIISTFTAIYSITIHHYGSGKAIWA